MRDMTPEQRQQCRRFLAELRRTGNIRSSADQAGVGRQTVRRWRKLHPAFATQWDCALAFARAALAEAKPQLPRTSLPKTQGGEYCIRVGKRGERQVRRAPPGRLSEAGETLFLRELAATCNIALACRAVGVSPSNIHRRRQRSDQFADRMDAALAQGHERLEFALMESALCSLAPEEMAGHWEALGVEPPSPLAVMTFDQVIIQMGLHMKRVALGEKRRGRNAHVTTAEETDAEITRLLGMLEKRKVALEKIDWETGERQAATVETVAASDAALRIGAGEGDAGSPGASARVRTFG